MLSIDHATIRSSAVGKSEKYIRAAFSLAAKLHPCVLFTDEADSLFCRRSSRAKSWERAATTQFLVEMEGLSRDPNAPLLVAATNRPWDLDEAFLRRPPQKFCVQLPDQAPRAAILRLFLKEQDLDPAVDSGGVASVTKGFSGSDLKSPYAEAALIWEIEQVKLDGLYGAVSPTFATARENPKRLCLDVDHSAAAFEQMQPNKARDPEDGLSEPQASGVEAAPYSKFDIESAHSTPDHQDLCTPDTPPTNSDTTTSVRGGPELTDPDLLRTGPVAPGAPKMNSGADVDLVPLLVTLAAVSGTVRR